MSSLKLHWQLRHRERGRRWGTAGDVSRLGSSGLCNSTGHFKDRVWGHHFGEIPSLVPLSGAQGQVGWVEQSLSPAEPREMLRKGTKTRQACTALCNNVPASHNLQLRVFLGQTSSLCFQ